MLKLYSPVTKISGHLQYKKGYPIGRFDYSIANNQPPDWLIYWTVHFDNGINHFLCREMEMDLDTKPIGAGEIEIDWKPDRIFALETSQPIPPLPPPPSDEEHPPPPIEPPPPPMKTYKFVEKERKPCPPNQPLIVGNCWQNGLAGTLTSPSGVVTKFTTGDKAGDFGLGGWSGEYAREAGIHYVDIAGVRGEVVTDGKAFIRLGWAEAEAVDPLVRLASLPMGRARADKIYVILQEIPVTKNVFKIEAV